MPGSVRLARIAGIDVCVHFSWLLIFAIVIMSYAETLPLLYPFWSDQKTLFIAAVSAILFFLSVVAHEFAHAAVARVFRMEVSSITLFLLGGVANLTKEPPTAKAEFFMAIAGPFTSLVIGVVGILVANAAGDPLLQPVEAIAGQLGPVNVALAVFNMLPGFPLDGGRVLRSGLWAWRRDHAVATRLAARGGQLMAVALALGGAFIVLRLREPTGAWCFLIAYFMWSAASDALQRERAHFAVAGARVRDLMTERPHTIQVSASVVSLVADAMLPFNLRAVPVLDGEEYAGVVSIADLRGVEQERWPAVRVTEVMRAREPGPALRPENHLGVALERFSESDAPLLPVLEKGRLVGVLDREGFESYVRLREMLRRT